MKKSNNLPYLFILVSFILVGFWSGRTLSALANQRNNSNTDNNLISDDISIENMADEGSYPLPNNEKSKSSNALHSFNDNGYSKQDKIKR